jgi:hypothetical protein
MAKSYILYKKIRTTYSYLLEMKAQDIEKFLEEAYFKAEYAGLMLDKCIEWIINPKVKVGTRALAFEYFYRTCQLYPEMAPEMLAIIDEQMERSPSAGLKSRMKQIRKKKHSTPI